MIHLLFDLWILNFRSCALLHCGILKLDFLPIYSSFNPEFHLLVDCLFSLLFSLLSDCFILWTLHNSNGCSCSLSYVAIQSIGKNFSFHQVLTESFHFYFSFSFPFVTRSFFLFGSSNSATYLSLFITVRWQRVWMCIFI